MFNSYNHRILPPLFYARGWLADMAISNELRGFSPSEFSYKEFFEREMRGGIFLNSHLNWLLLAGGFTLAFNNDFPCLNHFFDPFKSELHT